jgi:cytochrome c553
MPVMSRSCLLLLALAGALAVDATDSLGSGDAAAGKQKAQRCIACHGPAGISANQTIPSIAGQPEYFTGWQLVYMRDNVRANNVMTPFVKNMPDQDVNDLAAYYASLPPPKPPAGSDKAPQLTEAGRKLAVEHRCGDCHQRDLSGKERAARLAGQHEPYLLKALHEFHDGGRVGGNAAMPEVLNGLSDDDLKALAHFVADPK